MQRVLGFLFLFFLQTCQSSTASSLCPKRWLLFKDRCLGVFPVWTSWSTAETLCSQSEAHLLSLHSPEELEFVRKINGKLSVPVWLGGYSMSKSYSWFWSDGSPFSFSVYTNQTLATSNNDEACLEMTEDGDLNSAPCGNLQFYVCSKKIRFNFYSYKDEPTTASSDLSSDLSLFAVIWEQSESVAAEIIHSSSFLLELKSGSITQSCYDQFSQQEALYMGLVCRTLEALTVYTDHSHPDIRSLLADMKLLCQRKYEKQSVVAAPQWLQFSLQSFHSVVVDDPVYLLVALSARSALHSFVFESLPLPGAMSNSEAQSVYQRWRADSEREVQFTQRFKDVIENHQKEMDVYKSINIFRQELMNQRSLHKHVECV